jgi:hypothetical protein
MRRERLPPLSLLALAPVAACSLFASSPALKSPLRERLQKAETPTIEEAARTCFSQLGWTPDDVAGDAEGATVVSAKNSDKVRASVYIQPPGQNPRVTGDPAYDDPFWKCLARELAAPKHEATAEPASSSEEP